LKRFHLSILSSKLLVSGQEFNEIKEAIAGLALGELIIKDSNAIALGMGKKYKKIKTAHLI
jgi:hypothetical protein